MNLRLSLTLFEQDLERRMTQAIRKVLFPGIELCETTQRRFTIQKLCNKLARETIQSYIKETSGEGIE